MPALAPIAIFAYRRSAHLEKTIHTLKSCDEYKASEVYIFSDAARTPNVEPEVAAVRSMLRTIQTPNMRIMLAEENKGLASSIIDGVSLLTRTYGQAIIIEDDLLLHPSTLHWFNTGLDRYRDNPDVWQISGHQFATPAFRHRTEGFFLKLTTSWGWATWDRAWAQFDPEATGWEQLAIDKSLRNRFNLNGAYDYATMLERQMRGEIDSWAVRWWWSAFMKGASALFPPRSLVKNIGIDETATHARFGRIRRLLAGQRTAPSFRPPRVPEHLTFNAADQAAVQFAIKHRRILEILERASGERSRLSPASRG